MNLQLVYQYISSLSKNENMFYEKTKKKQKAKKRKSFQQQESKHGPPTCKVNALSIAPQQLILKTPIKLSSFNTFAHEILLLDAVWSWQSFIYGELKDIFRENKRDFDS